MCRHSRMRRSPPAAYAIQFPNVFPQALRGIPGAGTQDFRRANQIDLRDPQTQQWTATVERDLGWSTSLRVSYVGSYDEGSGVQPGPQPDRPNTDGYAAVRDQRPFKDWNVVTTRDNGSRARYNGMSSRGLEARRSRPELQLLLYAGEARLGLGRRSADEFYCRERSVRRSISFAATPTTVPWPSLDVIVRSARSSTCCPSQVRAARWKR